MEQNKQQQPGGGAPRRRGLWQKICRWARGLFRVYSNEFLLIFHDKGLILFLTFLPLAYPIIYSLIYNPEVVRKVAVVVVDSDHTPLSRELVRRLDATQGLHVLGYAADLSEARDAMARGDCYGILEIPQGMERKVGNGESAPAVLYCDMTLLLRYRSLLVSATDVMQEMGTEIMTETIDRVGPMALTLTDGNLLPIHNANLGNIKGGFDSFIMPIVLVLILHQCLVLAIGMAGGAKHENPRLIHYDPDNVARSTVGTMIGQGLCYITLLFIPTVFMIYYVPLIFQFPMSGNLIGELALLLPLALGAIGMGYVFQGIVTERESVFVSWVVTSVFLLFMTGAVWPRFAMPAFWRGLSDIFPSTWAAEGFIRMNGNGASLAQCHTEYINLWITAAVWWIAGWCMQKWVVRPEIKRWRAMNRSVALYVNAHKGKLSDDSDTAQ